MLDSLPPLVNGLESGVFDGQWSAGGPVHDVVSPIDGCVIGQVTTASAEDLERVLAGAHAAFLEWRMIPMPLRAEVVRQIGQDLRASKEDLARIVTREMGKTRTEALGEVQEMIDVCVLATGLGRQIGGLVLPSERPGHRLQEQWHPLGVVGVITAFNFPVAVWAWNLALALVCGDAVVWKPSSKAPLSAIACTRIAARVLERNGHPPGLVGLVVGKGREIGDRLVADPRVALVSYTGSVPTGRRIGQIVATRFGRSLLELGGNNAAIVTPGADMDQALAAVYFGAVGTSGQRCTTTRRLILHDSVYDAFLDRLADAFRRTPIGDPREEGVLIGPLVDRDAVKTMQDAISRIREQGGRIVTGGQRLDRPGCYVTPCLVEAPADLPMAREETFAPILYVFRYRDLEDAVRIQNDVPQGLSSAIFTNDLREAEWFIGPAGSDCGLANVNAGTSGAEIGGAFGGEKETGGGRESGSDAWKAYMRRQTSVINASGRVALAQGVRFELR